MNDELHDYIRQAHSDGADHQTIQNRLVNAGWHPNAVSSAIERHQANTSVAASNSSGEVTLASSGKPQKDPVGVVTMLSTRGTEYYLMLITLIISALGLGVLLLSLSEQLFGHSTSSAVDAGIMAFTTSALVISLPALAFLFLRLKKAELENPRLRQDPSRRRMIQIALILSFIVGIVSLIGFLFTFMLWVYGGESYELENAGALVANAVITIGISGGIFAYFWADSHRKGEQ